MSEYESSLNRSPMRGGNASNSSSSNNINDTLDDTSVGAAANNSIIGKVKSRVSSIFPNSLSKWFSPSTKSNNNNDSINNGSISGNARRRRRLEIEADEEEEEDDVDEEVADEEEDDEDEPQLGEYDARTLRRLHRQQRSQQQPPIDQSDEESNNSEEGAAATAALSAPLSTIRRVTSTATRQPPTKRSRLNMDLTNIRDSPLMQRQPLVASTPAAAVGIGNIMRSNYTQPQHQAHRYTHLNLYGHQSKKEPAYNFLASAVTTTDSHYESSGAAADIIDLVPLQATTAAGATTSGTLNSSKMSSRRSLNIPSTYTLASTERYTGLTTGLKRQSLASVKNELPSTSAALARRTSTTINETIEVSGDRGNDDVDEVQQNVILEEEEEGQAEEATKYNGRASTTTAYMFSKRQKLHNGATAERDMNEVVAGSGGVGGINDTASESSEGGADRVETVTAAQRKTGLFNMSSSSAANSRNGSRTSSFGNGLNFYTHLEGRKSLFAGGGTQHSNTGGNSILNNSTLSLNSLNRRQFNASIYGSTSALSDSRLLNTFSPFYKGKTTYGGASAYNKYGRGTAAGGTGAGASAVRITPTLIRPTSSLSTLSSSSNSLAATGGNAAGGGNESAISSTAKRILDLINEFATPLSEAKKMASNLKASQQQTLPNSKTAARLTEADLQATRAMRLAQVRTPYMRPTVTLQSTTALPPTRELQVPSMSQLLQMKKLQCTTERSRQITQKRCADSGSEYTLPISADSGGDAKPHQKQPQQQRHTNKIKQKVTSSVRASSAKDAVADVAPPPANLPNIAFPLMQAVPKIDIALPTVISKVTPKLPPKAVTSNAATFTFASSNSTKASGDTTPTKVAFASATPTTPTSAKINFKFSAPLELKDVTTPTQQITPFNGNYKFSPPTLVQSSGVAVTPKSVKPSTPSSPPQLKTGSVLDALKKPLTSSSSPAAGGTATLFGSNSFGNQFKKSSNEWECDACMIRNKQDASKCVACETPKKSATASVQMPTLSASATNSTINLSSSFGNQFKKSASEWECDACMLRNKQDANKCVACETPRKGAAAAASAPPSFGNAFKPKANSWECDTCLITNKSESQECVACQTKKPGATSTSAASAIPASTNYKFGLAAYPALAATNSNSDAGFKSLAAEQKASKWECEACMTRNEATRSKCVCCEQAKPGIQTAANEDVPKFAFGSSAAAKFTFGFGTAANAPKEQELRQISDSNKQTKPTTIMQKTETHISPAKGFTFASSSTTSTKSGTDVADSKLTVTTTVPAVAAGFTFGTSTAKTAAAVTSTSTGFTFGCKPAVEVASAPSATKTTTVSATDSSALSSPSVNFNLPTTTSTVETLKRAAPPAFGISGASTATKPAGGFSFGTLPSTAASSNKAATVATASTFAFKSPAVTTTTATTTTSASTAANSFGASNTTAVAAAIVKPMFSFGASTTTAAALPAASAVPAAASGFSFGSNTNVNTTTTVTSTPAASKPLFGVATTSASATAASTNVFGAFGSSSATNPIFGAGAPKVSSAAPATTAISTSSTTFGSFGGSSSGTATMSTVSKSTNVFGAGGDAFGSQNESAKPSTAVFGVPSSSLAPSATPFAFGVSTAAASSSTTPAAATTSTSTSWPKHNFVFGASATTGTTANTNETVNKPVFGSFGGTQPTSATATPAPSMFGNVAASASAPSTSFGSASGTSLFGSNSATAVIAPAAGSLFGAATTSGNAVTPAPAFGQSPFGGNTTTTRSTPTFGSTAAANSTTSFGGFGAPAAAASANDGASAAKKSEPAFNFGGPTAPPTQSTSGAFNFGATAATTTMKPSFNFAATSQQPAFNFTGAAEATPNAPFQFNAGAAPASNNIFAPAPTSGSQPAQQARRKIRAPIRRLTPR